MNSNRPNSFFRNDSNNGQNANNSAPKKSWGPAKETPATTDRDNKEILGLQSRIMEEQDRNLEFLSETIGRQKDLALSIGTEVDVSTGLLDDIHRKVDDTTNNVKRETLRISKFSDKAKTGVLWCIILLLIIAIIVLALI